MDQEQPVFVAPRFQEAPAPQYVSIPAPQHANTGTFWEHNQFLITTVIIMVIVSICAIVIYRILSTDQSAGDIARANAANAQEKLQTAKAATAEAARDAKSAAVATAKVAAAAMKPVMPDPFYAGVVFVDDGGETASENDDRVQEIHEEICDQTANENTFRICGKLTQDGTNCKIKTNDLGKCRVHDK